MFSEYAICEKRKARHVVSGKLVHELALVTSQWLGDGNRHCMLAMCIWCDREFTCIEVVLRK